MDISRFTKHLNFFRYHLLFFTFTPLVFSAIFYGANGSSSGNANAGSGVKKVEYIDALFLSYSAMTVTGLVTVNVSAVHPFQQALLFILFILGDFSFVSLIMVLVRKRFFRIHCDQLLRATDSLRPSQTNGWKFGTFGTARGAASRSKSWAVRGQEISGPRDVRRMKTAVQGQDEGKEEGEGEYQQERTASPIDMGRGVEGELGDVEERASGSTTAQSSAVLAHGYDLDNPKPIIENDHTPKGHTLLTNKTIHFDDDSVRPTPYDARQRSRARTRGMTIEPTILTPPKRTPSRYPPHIPEPNQPEHIGFGGFPGPIQVLNQLIPTATRESLRQRLTKPQHRHALLVNPTISSYDTEAGGRYGNAGRLERDVGDCQVISMPGTWGEQVKATVVRWMPDQLAGLVVGRNSRFFSEELDDRDLEQLGGVEYRALTMLSYLVPAYILLFQLVPFAIISICFSKNGKWDSAFEVDPGVQAASVSKTWSSLFVVVSAYTGTGMSLIDQNMAPFSTCYSLIFVLVVVLLAGNHALPIMLRLIIWTGTKIWRKGRIHETLHFLLDHPRRCFLYLFPSQQTWYLLFILISFVAVEMFAFLVLNIGLPVLDQLNGFQVFADALLQSLSVRASGFGIVPISIMAPSVLFLYLILMYVAIYPIAMSVRSTNVYEEQALGVYDPEDPNMNGECEPSFQGKRREVFSKYLIWHMRRQLAFDIWPLTAAVFLICIVERGKILDPSKSGWFTVFRIIFECTSAYSTIGLTMGTPNNNYSFAGELSTVSKLIMILVMLRGRHRGLPVAIDRAVLIPHEYARIDNRTNNIQSADKPEVVSTSQSGAGSNDPASRDKIV